MLSEVHTIVFTSKKKDDGDGTDSEDVRRLSPLIPVEPHLLRVPVPT